MIELRGYQQKMLGCSAEAETRGVRRQLIVAATGTGKTLVFAELLRRRGGRGLVLAHRDELISQGLVKLMDVDLELRPTLAAQRALYAADRPDLAVRLAAGPTVGIVKAEADDVDADVVVGSVQTLGPRRLAGLAGSFATVIVDEAHHATADSYQRILHDLGAGEPWGPLLVGVTATPDRGDGKGLDGIFDEVIANYGMLEGIRDGYLSDLRAVEVPMIGFDESDLRMSRGDYTAGSSGRALEAANAPKLIVQAWEREASGRRKTLVFLPTVETAQQTAGAFLDAGHRAAWISGETARDERRGLLRRFTTGEVDKMVNCAVLIEGYDEPSIDCIVIARPTRSRALYAQMVGRGSRRFPTKTDCLVLDMVGNSAQHSLLTLPSLFGVETSSRARTGKVTISEAVAEAAEAEAARLGQAQKAALFRPLPVSRIAWARSTDRHGVHRYVRSLGSRKIDGKTVHLPMVVLAPAGDELWSVRLLYNDRPPRQRILLNHTTLEMAQGIGEDYIAKNITVKAFADVNAPWRKQPPSERMLAAAASWRMPVDPTWTGGETSDALTAHIATKQLAALDKADKRQGARQ